MFLNLMFADGFFSRYIRDEYPLKWGEIANVNAMFALEKPQSLICFLDVGRKGFRTCKVRVDHRSQVFILSCSLDFQASCRQHFADSLFNIHFHLISLPLSPSQVIACIDPHGNSPDLDIPLMVIPPSSLFGCLSFLLKFSPFVRRISKRYAWDRRHPSSLPARFPESSPPYVLRMPRLYYSFLFLPSFFRFFFKSCCVLCVAYTIGSLTPNLYSA